MSVVLCFAVQNHKDGLVESITVWLRDLLHVFHQNGVMASLTCVNNK